MPFPSSARPAHDGSVPLLCAPTDVLECDPDGQCHRRSPDSVNLPPFIAVDVAGKMLRATDGSGRTAPIHRVEQVDGRVILQGGQEGRAWSLVIGGDTGKLSAAVLDQAMGFILFGACTAR